jgi:hypothetical protein
VEKSTLFEKLRFIVSANKKNKQTNTTQTNKQTNTTQTHKNTNTKRKQGKMKFQLSINFGTTEE